jgi:signal transduction histidine kinase
VISLDDEPILLTVAPIRNASDRLVGAVAMGTPVQEVLSQTKLDTLADLTLYDASGAAIRTTFVLADSEDLSSLTISPSIYVRTMEQSEQSTSLETFKLNAREYQTAFVPLVIRRDVLGVLGVSWPSTLITSVITTNRVGLGIIFSLVAMLVVLTGYGVALNLTRPIRRLADVARMVAAGDLSQQSLVRTSDEIGLLGRTFDTMTLNLNEKTEALLQSYQEQERRAAFLLAVISSAADGTVVIDPDTKIIHQNPAARAIIARDDLMWQRFFHDLPADLKDQPSLAKRMEVADTWIEAKAAPVVTASGEEIGIVVALRDITDEVMSDRMRSGFILQMSHELYTPLVAARGFNELAMKVIDDKVPVAHELLERSMESMGTLRSLIGQVLDVSRMLRGGFDIKREPLDLAVILEEVVAEYRGLMQSKQLRLQMDIAQLSLYAGGEDPLRWAFRHLVKNACDYTLPEGIIRISATEAAGMFVLKVRDTGVGITRYEKSRIFDQFYRGTPTAKDGRVIDVRGAGLGLFVVEQVARAHGGTVEVWSEQGIGSEFTFRIPYKAPSSTEPEVSTAGSHTATEEL